jgi:hypothetical protein
VRGVGLAISALGSMQAGPVTAKHHDLQTGTVDHNH